MFKDEKKSEIDQMLRTKPCLKFVVKCVRHMDKRDLRLVLPEMHGISPDRSLLELPWVVQNCKNHRKGDDCFTTESLENLLLSREDALRRVLMLLVWVCLETLGGPTCLEIFLKCGGVEGEEKARLR